MSENIINRVGGSLGNAQINGYENVNNQDNDVQRNLYL